MIDAVKLFVIKAVGGGLKKDDVRVFEPSSPF
jgi:hypothetical protein